MLDLGKKDGYDNNTMSLGPAGYLFDPIFQPVMPDELPKSKAISVQK